jgi:hypothetical protein
LAGWKSGFFTALLGRTKMPRPSRLQLPLAFIAGLVLLALTLFFMGVLATLPTPNMLQALFQTKGWIGVTLHSVLLVHLPAALLSGLFSFAVFRLLRAHDLRVAITLSAPWVIYCFVEAISYYQASQLSPPHKLILILAWHKWLGRLSVPLGIWAASKVSSSKERGVA